MYYKFEIKYKQTNRNKLIVNQKLIQIYYYVECINDFENVIHQQTKLQSRWEEWNASPFYQSISH